MPKLSRQAYRLLRRGETAHGVGCSRTWITLHFGIGERPNIAMPLLALVSYGECRVGVYTLGWSLCWYDP
jgi:hypothetical protein